MKRLEITTQTYDARKGLHVTLFILMMATCLLNIPYVRAGTAVPLDFHFAVAEEEFSGTRQLDVAYRFRPPRRLRAKHMELVVGAISSANDSRMFVSYGPVWRLPLNSRFLFVDLRLAPTFIGGSSFEGRDLGGNFHFTSSAAIGINFGSADEFSLSLRAQHTSNGGLHSPNPGLDMIGVSFTMNAGR